MKKGFTLIELLAVIAILAIILLIAVPKVIGIIDDSERTSFEYSAKSLLKTADTYISQNYKDITKPTDGNGFIITAQQILDSGNIAGLNDMANSVVVLYNNQGKYEQYVFASNGKYIIEGYQISDVTDSSVLGDENYATNLTDETEFVLIGKQLAIYVNTDPSGARNPDIASNLIPIYYDSVDSIWKKADVTNLNNTYKWYDYTTKKWANAVTVTNATRSTYQSAALGTPILETDILTYMVWLPKYKYRIPAGSGARTIDIVFEGSAATKSTGDAITSYRTHPAFAFGTTELNGIWMGKYELTGTSGAITTKPGIQSLRDQNVSSFFTAIRNMENASNPYGYIANEVDTHMIKNNEWGAAAYLSNSIYGKNAEVTINANSSYITGNPGPEASTTGNVYGIYDMSGCAYEYVMGNLENRSGYRVANNWNSGFNGLNGDGSTTVGIPFPESKYYNLYTTTNASTACNSGICHGEALSETANWYNDNASFVDTSYPWFMRGGDYYYGTSAGVFGSDYGGGGSGSNVSSRACQTKS